MKADFNPSRNALQKLASKVKSSSLEGTSKTGDPKLKTVGDKVSLGIGSAVSPALGSMAVAAAMASMGSPVMGGMMGMMGGMIGGMGIAGAAVGMAAGAAMAATMGSDAFAKKFANAYKEAKAKRSRNADGRFRTKSGKTQVDTLRETYGMNFAAGLPGNMPLQVLRAATGTSLTQMVKDPKKIDKARPKLAEWKAPELAPGGRTRNADGTIRQKRGDTKIDTLRKSYGPDLMAQLPGNWPLALVREATGMSLSKLVEHPEKMEEALPKIAAAAVAMDDAMKLASLKEDTEAVAKRKDGSSDDMDIRPGKVDLETQGGRLRLETDGNTSSVQHLDMNYRSKSVEFNEGETQTTNRLKRAGHYLEDGAVSNDITVTTDNKSGKIVSIQDNKPANDEAFKKLFSMEPVQVPKHQ